jgi:hypothetical protein
MRDVWHMWNHYENLPTDMTNMLNQWVYGL